MAMELTEHTAINLFARLRRFLPEIQAVDSVYLRRLTSFSKNHRRHRNHSSASDFKVLARRPRQLEVGITPPLQNSGGSAPSVTYAIPSAGPGVGVRGWIAALVAVR